MAFGDRGNGSRRLKVGIIGSGISGLSAAWLLAKHHDVTVFEAADRIGGHSNTVTFKAESGERGCGRYRLHRLQRSDISQSHGAVQNTRCPDGCLQYVFRRLL